LETAHPVKFLDIVESTLKTEVSVPSAIQDLIKKEKRSREISSYEDLKSFLINS
jgi:threonine synthase